MIFLYNQDLTYYIKYVYTTEKNLTEINRMHHLQLNNKDIIIRTCVLCVLAVCVGVACSANGIVEKVVAGETAPGKSPLEVCLIGQTRTEYSAPGSRSDKCVFVSGPL